ncbi:MAG TPA: LPXTG cell wall anchor domain-containing protein, partial [Firmicutes bacterium]|nr:LPXTG cell wall anchor domain-containing protein [Bacillota bacterium]
TANFEQIDYTLALEVDPEGGGTVNGGGTYNYGDEVQVSATAASDYIFVNWIDENGVEVSSEPNFAYTMPNRNVTLTAIFEEDITIEPEPPGVDPEDPEDPEEPELPVTGGSIIPLFAGLLIAGAGMVIKKKRK